MPLFCQQILRQTQRSWCVPSRNLPANPQVSHSEISLDEQLAQQTARCLLWCAKLWQRYSLTCFTYERNLSLRSQEHTALICFLYNTLFSFLLHFDYLWRLLRYCSLFVIALLFVVALLFVIHFLACSPCLPFFFAIALFVCILFLQYFFPPFVIIFLYWPQWNFISVHYVACFHFIISCVCATQPPLLSLTVF